MQNWMIFVNGKEHIVLAYPDEMTKDEILLEFSRYLSNDIKLNAKKVN